MRAAVVLAVGAVAVSAASVTVPFFRRSGPAPRKRRSLASVSVGDKDNDNLYYALVEIGTPPVSYGLQLDTGSVDLVIVSAGCTTATGCIDTTVVYNSLRSTTAVLSTTPFSSTYADGSSINGTVVQDVVSMGHLSIPKQLFGAATSTGGNGLDGATSLKGYSGIIGLGFQVNNTVGGIGAVPFMQALYNSGQLDQPLFSVSYATEATSPYALASGGYLTIGGTNSTFYSGDIHYIPVSTPATALDWIIPCDGIVLNGNLLPGTRSNTVDIDTGTTGITVPHAVAVAFYASIPEAVALSDGQTWAFPCSTVIHASFRLGGQDYAIPPSSFNQPTTSAKICTGAIGVIASLEGTGLWLLGDLFLQSVYVVFRYSPPSIGFAPLLDPNRALENSPIPFGNGTQVNGSPVPIPGADVTGSRSSAGAASPTGAGAPTASQKAEGARTKVGVALGGMAFVLLLVV